MGWGRIFDAEGRKMTVPVIFRFYVLRGRRTKGLHCRPFVNTRNQREDPLDTPDEVHCIKC